MIFSVYADHVTDKNGNEVPQYLSVVPKCLFADSIAGVAVLPVRDGRVGVSGVPASLMEMVLGGDQGPCGAGRGGARYCHVSC